MSHEVPSPPTLRTAAGYELQAAGYQWDAIRAPRSIGARALEFLGSRSGAVIEDPHEPALYWFIAVGKAAAWDLPDTKPLSLTQYLVVPAPHRTQAPGPHWRIPCGERALRTEVDVLRAALVAAARLIRSPLRKKPEKFGHSHSSTTPSPYITPRHNAEGLFP